MKREERKLQKLYLDEWQALKPEPINKSAVLENCIRQLSASKEAAGESFAETGEVEVIRAVEAKRGRFFGMAAVVTACLVLLLMLFNAAAPELAEQIPVLGNFFRMINHQRGENEVLPPPETSKAPESSEMVESSEVSVVFEEIQGDFEADDEPDVENQTLYLSGTMTLSKPIDLSKPYEEELTFWLEDLEGKRLTEPQVVQDREEEGGRLEKIIANGWGGDNPSVREEFCVRATCPLPENSVFESREVCPRLTYSLSYYTEEGEPYLVKGEASWRTKWTQSARANGFVLNPILSWEREGNIYPALSAVIDLVDERGNGEKNYVREVRCKFDGSTYWFSGNYFEIDTESKTIAVMAYESLPDYQLGKVLAEFTVDLETGEISATQDYRDPESPLFWDRELWEQEDWAYPYYRAEDWELEELYDGYKVEYVSAGHGVGGELGNSSVITVVTDREYRELDFQVKVENFPEKRLSINPPYPTGTGDWTYGFCPLSEFSPQRYLRENSAENEIMAKYYQKNVYMGVEERTLDRDDLNIMFFSFGHSMLKRQRFGFQEGDTVKVTILDKETQEVLHEETVTMRLPEDFPLPEGCHVGRISGPGFPYVAVPDDCSPED